MHISAILTPVEDLMTIGVSTPVGDAIRMIEENGFLSLPVVEERQFAGFLSKQFVYDIYFKEGRPDFDSFMQRPVKEFLHNKVEAVEQNLFIEEAAQIFLTKKVRFIPVVDDDGDFAGIVTQKALFELITKVYGLTDPKIVLYTQDFKGVLAKIAETIFKAGGNITHIVHTNTDVMGLQEISIRLQARDVSDVVHKLKEKGFKVREFLN